MASSGLELLWNYRLQGLSDTEVVEVAVHGIEMVYVPEALSGWAAVGMSRVVFIICLTLWGVARHALWVPIR